MHQFTRLLINNTIFVVPFLREKYDFSLNLGYLAQKRYVPLRPDERMIQMVHDKQHIYYHPC